MFVFTYTANPLAMMDLDALSRDPGLRLTAMVERGITGDFRPYARLFDHVYEIEARYANHCFVQSFCPSAIDAVARENRNYRDLKLLSFFEGDIEATAQLRDRFHLRGMGASQARNFRDKWAMKRAVGDAGYPVPRALELDWSRPESMYARCVSTLGAPFLIKPVDLGGSLGVVRVQSRDRFEQSLDADYLAEEEVAGDLLHLDLVVVEDRPVWFGCSIYNASTLAFASGTPVGSMPLLPDDPQFAPLRDYAAGIARTLRVRDSLVHIEAIRHGERLYFLEAAARASGGLVAQVYERMFGYNMIQAHVLAHAGVPYQPGAPDGMAYFWLLLPEGPRVEQWLRERDLRYECFPAPVGSRIRGSLIGQYDRLLVSHPDYHYLRGVFTAVAALK